MAYTIPQLVESVLLELTIIAAGETPDAETADTVTKRYRAAVFDLEQRGIAAWDVEAIPDAYFLALTVETVADL